MTLLAPALLFAVLGQTPLDPARTTGTNDPLEAPPEALRQGFYTKCAYYKGMPILGDDKVDDRAFHKLVAVFDRFLAKCDPQVMPTLVKGGTHYSIIADEEGQTALPELAFQRNDPNMDWDKRARGMGGKTASGGEENILEYEDDRYRGECIYLHEFSHTLDRYAFGRIDPKFRPELRAAYEHAKTAGLWKKTYGIGAEAEYFAEGVQMYFDCARWGEEESGVHNHVINREGLKAYDPRLFALIDRTFGGNPWRYEGKYNTTGQTRSYDFRVPRTRPTTPIVPVKTPDR